MRLIAVIAVLLAALAVGACGSSGAGNPASKLSASQVRQPITGAPPQLASIRAQASQIVGGGTSAFNARLAQLRGTPVVVNKWASWCGPCRLEFPFFQSEAIKHGGQIAFLGDFANDSTDAGMTFLGELPLPYPSYNDPDQSVAAELRATQGFPATAFYDRAGHLAFTHLGQYADESQLAADITRYAR